MPASRAAQLQPRITHAIVSAYAGALGTCKDMLTMSTQLMMTSFAGAHGGVMTPLASLKDREAHMGSQRQAERASGQQQVRGGSVPAHLTPLLPTQIDLTVSGVGETGRRQPWTDVTHLKGQSLIKEFTKFTGLSPRFKMSDKRAKVHPGVVIQILQSVSHSLVQGITCSIRSPFSN